MMHDGKSFNPVTGKIGGGPCDAVEDAAQAVVDIQFNSIQFKIVYFQHNT